MTLDVTLFLQELRTPFLDFFFNMISFLGEETIYILVLAIVYFGIDKTKGEFIAFILFFTGIFNTFLKGMIDAPRPFEKYPNLVDNLRPETTGGSSFPSGHTQNFTAFLVSGALLLKQKRYLVIAIVMSLLMALSRMYLGVHFLEDVLTSLILGILTAYIGFYIFFKYYRYRDHIYLGIALVSLSLIFIVQTESYLTAFSLFTGFALAMVFEHRIVNVQFNKTLLHRILRVVFGLIIIGGLKVTFSLFPDYLWLETCLNIIMVFAGFGLYPLLIKEVQKRLNEYQI